VRAAIEEPANDLYISHAAVWEIVDKAAKFRLPMAGFSVDRIVERIDGLQATIVPIQMEDILTSVKLPKIHGDPMDRLLIAQAQQLGATLLSKDGMFKLYDVPVLWS
jgi:PIN domain nuclease of toxin-antitoxin system